MVPYPITILFKQTTIVYHKRAMLLLLAMAMAMAMAMGPVFVASASPSGSPGIPSLLLSRALSIKHVSVHYYKDLHQIPELLFDLHETSAYIQKELTLLGIPFEANIAKTGIVAYIGKDSSVKQEAIVLRADMDALPVTEETNLPFKSKNEGKGHMCGHDAHMSGLLTAARLLLEDAKAGRFPKNYYAKLMFQPAEEGGAGARVMRDQHDILHDAVAAFGVHVGPGFGKGQPYPTGNAFFRHGPMLAAAGEFDITVTGHGTHGAAPHSGVDPIVCGAAIVQSLQQIVSRRTDPLDAAVVTVGTFHSGVAHNVIPSTATLSGTFRALKHETFERLEANIESVARHAAAAHDCKMDIHFHHDTAYPPTVLDEGATAAVRGAAEKLLAGYSTVGEMTAPIMGAEDFSFIAESVPSTFVFVGTANATLENAAFVNHHPRFVVDPEALPVAAALHVSAFYALSSAHQEGTLGEGSNPSSNGGKERKDEL